MRTALTDPENEMWLSPITVWEPAILVERGRILVSSDPREWIRRMLDAVPRREAPITHEIALASRRLSSLHPDPADRFLAATAKVLEVTLVTADRRLLECAEIEVMEN